MRTCHNNSNIQTPLQTRFVSTGVLNTTVTIVFVYFSRLFCFFIFYLVITIVRGTSLPTANGATVPDAKLAD